jgi:hypothetical protein
MAWLISKALYEKWPCSQEQAVESLEAICSDGKQSAQLSGSHIQLAYLQPDKMTEFSRLSRFGMTFKPLTESRGADLLMWFREDFLAKTYPAQERAQELTEPGQACGSTWQELSVKYDPATHSWRTHLCLWDEALQWSSVTLPKWGMTVSGALFQHPTAERPISGTGSGSWPTPAARDGNCTNTIETLMQGRFLGQLPNAVKLWSTPAARDWKGHTVTANHPQGFNNSLANDVLKWPTPQASDNRDRGNLGSGAIQRRKDKGKQIMLSQSVSDTSGALNPLWVEWLMGFPLGWTDLKPLETARFQSWLQLHGGY